VRLPHLLDWLAAVQPEAVCLQETKTEDANFPVAEIRAAGYEAAFCGQKTYNGVAILSRTPLADVQHGIPGFPDDPKRLIAATVGGVRILSVYAPNGQEPGSDKYAYKLRWFDAFTSHLKSELQHRVQLAAAGDYNVAPDDRDVHDPKRWKDKIHASVPERAAFKGLLDLGLKDAFRLFEQPEKEFSWWDYRLNAFARGWGLRIDEILVSAELARRCTACAIDKGPRQKERPSDHAPVFADLAV
jgi:exodeoxyribonuclease-3